MARDLAADETTNFVRAFEVLATHAAGGIRRSFDGVEVAATGAARAWFNPAFVVGAVNDAEAVLQEVVDVLAAAAPRFAIHVVAGSQPGLEAAAAALGLETSDDLIPGMAMRPIDVPDATGRLEIVEVASGDDWEEFSRVTVDPFGLTPEIVATAFPYTVTDEPGTHWFLGRFDGEVIGTAATIIHDDVAGIYNIGVLEQHRGKGFGRDLTAAAVRAGLRDGCEVAVLQSSDAGFSVYQRMGFRTVNRYRSFVGGVDPST